MDQTIKEMAKILGRRGGKARAKSLSAEQRRKIALLGAKSRARSLEVAKRIERNFRYVEAIRQLSRKTPKVTRVKTYKFPLPSMGHG